VLIQGKPGSPKSPCVKSDSVKNETVKTEGAVKQEPHDDEDAAAPPVASPQEVNDYGVGDTTDFEERIRNVPFKLLKFRDALWDLYVVLSGNFNMQGIMRAHLPFQTANRKQRFKKLETFMRTIAPTLAEQLWPFHERRILEDMIYCFIFQRDATKQFLDTIVPKLLQRHVMKGPTPAQILVDYAHAKVRSEYATKEHLAIEALRSARHKLNRLEFGFMPTTRRRERDEAGQGRDEANIAVQRAIDYLQGRLGTDGKLVDEDDDTRSQASTVCYGGDQGCDSHSESEDVEHDFFVGLHEQEESEQ
jgi:hypothetical protein